MIAGETAGKTIIGGLMLDATVKALTSGRRKTGTDDIEDGNQQVAFFCSVRRRVYRNAVNDKINICILCVLLQ